MVRAEGLTERASDILLACSGFFPGTAISDNLALYFPVSVTNRVDNTNLTHDAVVSVDYGTGFTPLAVAGQVAGSGITFNGVSLTVPASGSFSLRISNVLLDANQLGATATQPLAATISTSLPLPQSQVTVATAQTAFLATLDSTGIYCTGSALPSTMNMASLFSARTAFASTRISESFGDAFLPRAAGQDNGTRFLIDYSSFPANATLYLPDLVAGSDALVPTAGGDLGVPQDAGQYVPGSGTLLLARVTGADSTGTGGAPFPTPIGSSPVTLNSVSPVPLANGSGYAVYEVVDSGSIVRESAQFPTFFGIPQVNAATVAQESIAPAPVSSVYTASPSAPIQRFAAVTPASDCALLGDCQASYFPHLSVDNTPIQLTLVNGAETGNLAYIPIQNAGGGILNWTDSVVYQTGSGWLNLYNAPGSLRAGVNTSANLAAGTYTANLVIDAGPLAGSVSIPVTLTVQVTSTPPAPPQSSVTVTGVLNAATLTATPLVPGSLGTVMGSNLAGQNVVVTFDGTPAFLLYTSATQINLQVPASLGAKTSASLVVTVDGSSSAPQTVPLSPAWPSIFNGGILNQDNSPNSATDGAAAGTILQIFATGIPNGATVAAQIGSQANLVPLYAGPAPTLNGVQQVNVAVPTGLTPGNTTLILCATVAGQPYCSAGSPLFLR
jgi:uncharacterized protein (TIGR03437 family)